MPIIKYTVELEGDVFSETGTFYPTLNPTATIEDDIIAFLNACRATHREPLLTLKKVEVLNPHVHLHSYRKIRVDKFAQKTYYVCDRCGISAYRHTTLFHGESPAFNRDEQWKSSKFELCHDPLKPMPQSTKLKFK